MKTLTFNIINPCLQEFIDESKITNEYSYVYIHEFKQILFERIYNSKNYTDEQKFKHLNNLSLIINEFGNIITIKNLICPIIELTMNGRYIKIVLINNSYEIIKRIYRISEN